MEAIFIGMVHYWYNYRHDGSASSITCYLLRLQEKVKYIYFFIIGGMGWGALQCLYFILFKHYLFRRCGEAKFIKEKEKNNIYEVILFKGFMFLIITLYTFMPLVLSSLCLI